MDWFAMADIVIIPLAFAAGRYSSRFRFVRVKRRYKQNIGEFIRGR